MPIAKTAVTENSVDSKAEVKTVDIKPVFTSEAFEVNNVPVDLYRFFNVDMALGDGQDLDTLKETYNFLKGELEPDSTIGDVMAKLRDIEMKLTPTQIGESRIGKIYNWLKLNNSIKETRKQQEALETRGII